MLYGVDIGGDLCNSVGMDYGVKDNKVAVQIRETEKEIAWLESRLADATHLWCGEIDGLRDRLGIAKERLAALKA